MRAHRLMAALAVIPALSGVGCTPQVPGWQHGLAYRTAELSPFVRDGFGFVRVPVTIDGATVSLILDTGNMSGLFVAGRLADSLHWSVTGASHSSDADGRPLPPTRRFTVRKLELFGVSHADVEAVEDNRFDIPGSVGPRYLFPGRFTVDYRHGWLAYSRSLLPLDARGTRLALVASGNYPGMPVVEGLANGVPVLIQLDTGKSRTCVDPDLVRQLALARDAHGVRGLRVTLGDQTFDVPSAKEVGFAGISDGYPKRIWVGVGVDVLSQAVTTVDYGRGILMLSPY